MQKTKITLNYPKSAAMGFLQETQDRVRNSRGKRVISVRAIEVLLYLVYRRYALMCKIVFWQYEMLGGWGRGVTTEFFL